eukprot:TRINITY_DN3287_c0_g1_i1.p1 TRINITY_DN3287_c0_g1~~TRINITY_DN3287_c0_g1_i1.p1  ORF type:complete len:348 (+),score=91.20 TRINITY_DN3287_c0_g1_i1:51-1094(+)
MCKEQPAGMEPFMPKVVPSLMRRKLANGTTQYLLGDWVLGKRLGQGSFGYVRQVRHCHTQQKAAVKILDKKGLTESDIIAALKEAYLGFSLDHENIVKTIEVMESHQGVFIVQELVEGGDLHCDVPKTGLSEEAAARAFLDLMNGLLHMHERGVAHLDVKPRNVLRGTDGTLKLCDFGLSEPQEVEHRAPVTSGTLRFAAPEILQGTALDGYAVDMWACGVTLCYLLVGKTPWIEHDVGHDKDDKEARNSRMREQISAVQYTLPEHVSPQAQDLVKWLLSEEPFSRPTVEEVLEHPWMKSRASREAADCAEVETSEVKGLEKLKRALCPRFLKNSYHKLRARKEVSA